MRSLVFLFFIFTSIFLPLSATNLDCEIGAVQVETLPCGDGGFFAVEIDFDFANVGNEGFKIQGNGNNYGNFEYEALPITIDGLLGDGQTEYEFVVTDNQFGECTNWGGIDPVDCGVGDCWISELIIDDNPCDGGYYSVYLDFEYEDVSEEGFKLFIDGDLYESYSYEDLPLNIGPLIGNGEKVYHFLVRDIVFEDCASDKNFGPIDCSEDCNIWDVEAEVLPCNEAGYFSVSLNFEYANVGNEGFRVQGNGNNYGDFEYEALPIVIEGLEGDGETVYEFVAIDNQNEGCSDWTAIEPVDCGIEECFISELSIDDYPCDGGFYNIYLNFEYANVGDEGFKLFVNWEFYGEYSYEDLPLNIGPFPGDGSTENHFLVRDGETESCASDKWFGPIDCEEDDCNIWDMTSTILPCNDDDQFNVLINFFYENVGNDGFKIQGNGTNYGTFSYDSLPVELGPFEAGGETTFEFVSKDNQYEDCSDWTTVEPFDCDTIPQLYNLDLEITDCAESKYFLNINLDYTNLGEEGFFLSGNGIEPQTYSYEDLPVKVGPLTNDQTTSYYFVFRDKENLRFGNWERFFPFNCDNLSVDEKGELLNLVNIYPIPSKGDITFDNVSHDKLEIHLYNDKGQMVNTVQITAESQASFTNLDSGLYFYSANTNKHKDSGKFIVVNSNN